MILIHHVKLQVQLTNLTEFPEVVIVELNEGAKNKIIKTIG